MNCGPMRLDGIWATNLSFTYVKKGPLQKYVYARGGYQSHQGFLEATLQLRNLWRLPIYANFNNITMACCTNWDVYQIKLYKVTNNVVVYNKQNNRSQEKSVKKPTHEMILQTYIFTTLFLQYVTMHLQKKEKQNEKGTSELFQMSHKLLAGSAH